MDQFSSLRREGRGSGAVRIKVEAGTGKSRVLDEILFQAMLTRYEAAQDMDLKHILMVTPTGVLAVENRRRWQTCESVTIDTFDGAFDTLEEFDFTQWSLAQYDAWVLDECEYLTPVQWRRLITMSSTCP